MDTEIFIDKGRTGRDVQYSELTITLGSGRDVTIIIFADNRAAEPRKDGV